VAPGQFVMLEIPDRIRPFLRRAYSVADTDRDRGEIEFLVKAIGAGTAALATLGAGEKVHLLGPLGNAFSLAGLERGGRVAVVAGGIGAAPFPLLYRALEAAGVTGDFFFGGRSSGELEMVRRFERIVNGEIHLATDDGSRGTRGYVTDLFARVARETRYARLYACGPMPMFAALAAAASGLALPAEFSTEAIMGCGFGACLACVIPGTSQPYLVSCQEGPILAPDRISW
jgi:dihydroorotate dehydrogenase electron transfer subunit